MLSFLIFSKLSKLIEWKVDMINAELRAMRMHAQYANGAAEWIKSVIIFR